MVQAEAELEKLGISTPIHLKKISRFAQDPILKPMQVFLSHSKLDTGAEAQLFYESLIANELEVFLDVDNIFPMKQLMKLLQSSKILVILFSASYLRRPYCLIKLITAIKCELKLIIVNIVRIGNKPDYGSILNEIKRDEDKFISDLLDDEGWLMLKNYDISKEDVRQGIKKLFNIKGIEYHSVASINVQNAEIENVLKILNEFLLERDVAVQNIGLIKPVSKSVEEFKAAMEDNDLEKMVKLAEQDFRVNQNCELILKLCMNVHEKEFTGNWVSACKLIVEAMKTFLDDALSTVTALRAIRSLASENESNCLYLGEIGTCEIVVKALNVHLNEKEVAEEACAAIWILASKNDANQIKFGACGGCEIVVKALNLYLNEKKVAAAACVAIWGLAANNDANQIKFGACEGCEVVVKALNVHLNEKEVAENACGAIWSLAVNDDANKIKFGACEGCEVVVKALNVHLNEKEVAKNACAAIWNLAANNAANTIKFGACEGCEVVVKALNVHLNEKEVAKQACGAIANLSLRHESRLNELGAKELIQRCIENEQKQRALSNLNGCVVQ